MSRPGTVCQIGKQSAHADKKAQNNVEGGCTRQPLCASDNVGENPAPEVPHHKHLREEIGKHRQVPMLPQHVVRVSEMICSPSKHVRAYAV